MLTKTKPRPYQARVVETVVSNDLNAFFLNFDPGLGKTKTTIDIVANLFVQKKITAVWIIAPNSVHRQWVDEQLPIHCPVPYHALVYSAKDWAKVGYQKDYEAWLSSKNGLKVLSINIETFAQEQGLNRLRDIYRACKDGLFLCIDESTKIKTPTAKRTKTIIDLAHRAKYTTCLSGTPVTNSPFDVWAPYEALRKGYLGNFFSFKHRYGLMVQKKNQGKAYQTIAGEQDFRLAKALSTKDYPIEYVSSRTGFSESALMYINAHPDLVSPYIRLDELREKIAPITFVVRREDVAKEIPDKIYAPLYIDFSAEQLRIYKELKKNLAVEYEGKPLTVQTAMNLIGRLQQVTGGFFPVNDPLDDTVKWVPLKDNPKLEALLSSLEDDPKDSIIIWAVYKAEIEAIYDKLKKAYPELRIEHFYSQTKGKAEIIDAFKRKEVQILVAHPKSAGIGLNLQVCALNYIYSNGFSLEDRIQQEDRTCRIGQDKGVVYKDIYIKGSIDEKIKAAFTQRKSILDFFRGAKDLLD
jgi:SNF2 family DNA or RNA helicase